MIISTAIYTAIYVGRGAGYGQAYLAFWHRIVMMRRLSSMPILSKPAGPEQVKKRWCWQNILSAYAK